LNGFVPIKGKCLYWREHLEEEDRYDSRLKKDDWRVQGTCFVDGDTWDFTASTIPPDCPLRRKCRYYIRSG